ALIGLTAIAGILLIGIICSTIADKFKISNILLLIITGVIINNIKIQGNKIIEFSPVFLTSLATLALVMIVFDGTSRFKWREIDTFSVKVLKLVLVFIVFNAIFLTIATHIFFRLESTNIVYEIALALIFAFINCETDPGSVLVMLKNGREKISKILQIESVLNTPFIVLLPFIIIDLMESVRMEAIIPKLAEQFLPFIQQFVTGVGSGVLIGIIFFKFMKKRYSEQLSPLAIVTAALITYTLAENLGGNGVLAVTVLGLFFGNVIVAQKEQLKEFSNVFTNALEILVFVFIGIVIEIPRSPGFLFGSIFLFLIYLVIRFAAIQVTFKGEYNFKEKLFMTLNVSKGITVASIAFAITILYADENSILYNLKGVMPMLNLTLIFMLYSIILSTIVIKYIDLFLKKHEEAEPVVPQPIQTNPKKPEKKPKKNTPKRKD
ncbi:hypothetical protein A3K72_01350, partial [Candidatus Woesearchaeota archaeon RBG_13_36_6]